VLGRELAAAALLERTGCAEVCVIAPQYANIEDQLKPAPVPTAEPFNQRGSGSATRAGLQRPSISRNCHFDATGLWPAKPANLKSVSL
jgi:hypothetical protein